MSSRFDEFSEALAQQHSRRGVLRIAASAAIGASLTLLGRSEPAEPAGLVEQGPPCPPAVLARCKQLDAQRRQLAESISNLKNDTLPKLQKEAQAIQANIDNLN